MSADVPELNAARTPGVAIAIRAPRFARIGFEVRVDGHDFSSRTGGSTRWRQVEDVPTRANHKQQVFVFSATMRFRRMITPTMEMFCPFWYYFLEHGNLWRWRPPLSTPSRNLRAFISLPSRRHECHGNA